MSKINTLNRSTLKGTVRPALEAKLKELSDELGISITAAKASFDPDGVNATFKLNLAVVDGESGKVMTQERQDFIQMGHIHGLSEDMLDKELSFGGTRLRVIGLKSKAPKNNVLLETAGGVQKVAPASLVISVYRQNLAA